MDYRGLLAEENHSVDERYALVMERIREIPGEAGVRAPYRDYFVKMAQWIETMELLYEKYDNGETEECMEALTLQNHRLYRDILPENYEHSYGNPSYAAAVLGEDYGALLSFVYTELRAMIVYAYEGRKLWMTMAAELFMEIYGYFEDGELPRPKSLQKAVYWYISDYSDVTMEFFLREQMDDALSFIKDIICEADLTDLSYLYKYGEYVGDNEIKLAAFMNQLPEAEVEAMAATFVDGFIRGFLVTRKDISVKDSVCLRARMGFERVLRASIRRFEGAGLKVHIFRNPVTAINKQMVRYGFLGTSPNPQYDYDHRADHGLFVDKALNERRLWVFRVLYEKYKKTLAGYAGPACLGVFGEEPFIPLLKPECIQLSEKQQKLMIEYNHMRAELSSQYMDENSMSFTMIAYPLPEIGSDFEAIFRETVKVNTLDNDRYSKLQQTLVDTLDLAEYVHIKGARGKNATDIAVRLHPIADPKTQTNFENCVADVNIPVGEVFTSPRLHGTTGTINVSSVYLNGYNFNNLTLVIEDGMVEEYSCDNFGEEEENRRYIRENILKNYESLPMGEFAIGTNTTAYVMAKKYGILHKLPILIVEKTGPHFALGDTCYSRCEDHKVYNLDGKEIIARENECSAKRDYAPEEAYFNCHTDITIPYDEIGEISAVLPDGSEILIIKDGRFVLAGTEALNEAFV